MIENCYPLYSEWCLGFSLTVWQENHAELDYSALHGEKCLKKNSRHALLNRFDVNPFIAVGEVQRTQKHGPGFQAGADIIGELEGRSPVCRAEASALDGGGEVRVIGLRENGIFKRTQKYSLE